MRERKLTRLRGYNYARSGYYFVTVCAYNRAEWFGRIENGNMTPNEYGKIVSLCWDDLPVHYANVKLDEFGVMPNHVHGIIMIENNVGNGLKPFPTQLGDARFNGRRRKELLGVSEIYKRNGSFVTPFMPGIIKKSGRFSKGEMLYKLRAFIRARGKPDIVFTHNRNGEYGHRTHKLVNEIVKRAGLGNIYTFSFGIKPKNGHNGEDVVDLSNRSMAIKKQAIRLYLKGSQNTNLSRIKGLLERAMTAKEEKFIHSTARNFRGRERKP